MKRQKRVAVINDVTGFGRCSAAVAQPIISAMKIQCCVMPTRDFQTIFYRIIHHILGHI